MAINSQKFLPPSKIKSSSGIVRREKIVPSLYTKTAKLSATTKLQENQVGSEEVVSLAKKVDQISNLISGTSLLKKKTEKENRKEREDKRREEKENKLEKKDNKLIPKLPSFNLPKLGFLDAINRFITFTLLGWVIKRILPHLPQILDFIKKIDPVIKFLEILSVNFFKGLVDFIDFGYKAHDTVRDFTKKLGGEPFQKAFDDFSNNLNTFVNLAIIAGMLSTGGPDFRRRGGKPGPGTKPRPRVTRGSDFRNPLKQRPKITGDVGGAAKNAGRFAKLGRFGVPVIGGLLDFGIRTLVFKEPVDRSAAGAIGFSVGQALGSWIGGAIGTAAGTVVPIIGNLLGGAAGVAVGGILGGMLGDLIGTSLLDTIKYYQTKNESIKKQATGGKVTTRKGKVVGGQIKRTVRRVTAPSKPKQVKPGASVGGEKKIKEIFPEPPKNQIGKMMNPYGFLFDTTNKMGSIPFLGPIFNIFGKVLMGDIPTREDFKMIGFNINAWIGNAISKGDLQGNLMSAFADGGLIDIGTEMRRNISGWVEKSVEELVRNKVTNAINELRKNLGLRPVQENIMGQDVTDDGSELGSASDAIGGARLLMKAGFPMLAASILAGNIQQESGWNGQRTPWVLNDGAGTNKGLISWNQTRIANAEKFLGKPLETASNAEQVKWIKEELRQYGLLDEFMDPNRTEEQLKEDSYKYIRWGHLGDRWKYSRQIFSSLQKGEQGTYKPPITGERLQNATEAQKLIVDLGKFIQKKGVAKGSGVHENPSFGGVKYKHKGRAHYEGRAIDIGGYGGRYGISQLGNLFVDDQTAILSAIREWSKKTGKTPYLLHGDNDPDHWDHVHAEFKKGGQIGEQKVKPLQRQAYYEEGSGSMVYILPIRVKEQVPVHVQGNRTSFPGGLNRSMSSRVPMR